MAAVSAAILNLSKIMHSILEESICHPFTTSTLVIRQGNNDQISIEVLSPPQPVTTPPGEREQHPSQSPGHG
jgi:hypothetical protein